MAETYHVNQNADWTSGEGQYGATQITVTERQESRHVGTDSAVLVFELEGTADQLFARKAGEQGVVSILYTILPASKGVAFDGKPLQGIVIAPDYVNAADNIGRWTITASFGLRAFSPVALLPGTVAYLQGLAGALFTGGLLSVRGIEFDISSQQKHITQGLSRVAHLAADMSKLVDYGLGINPSGEGQNVHFAGCDVPWLKGPFNVIASMPSSQMTPAYRKQLRDLVGHVNDGAFTATVNGKVYAWAVGEVVFHGAPFKEVHGADTIDITFRFEESANRAAVTVQAQAGAINLGDVKGWDYLSFGYGHTTPNNNKYVPPLVQVDVMKTVLDGDFSVLGIS